MNQDNRTKQILFLAAALLLLVFFSRPSISFVKEKPVLEKGENYPAEDFVLKSNGEVIPESEYLPSEEIGLHVFRYKVRKGIFTREVSFAYEVADTTPPQVTILETEIHKDFGEAYSEAQMRENIITDEGRIEIETDYDAHVSGTYPVKVTVTDDSGNETVVFYEASVRDTEAPILFRTGNGKKILRYSVFDIDQVISYGDNCDPHPKLDLEGKVDTSRLGRYPLHACVTDASGNRTEWDFTVEVTDHLPEEEARDYFYPFADFREEYARTGRKLGIDVSEWQDEIDFEAVKAAGCEFVIMRIGFSHGGKLTVDKEFERNLQGARDAGLAAGVYLFSYDSSEEELLSTLKMVFETLDGAELQLPIAFDWENFSHFQTYGISFRDLDHFYDVFLEEIGKQGYEGMLYGSRYFLEEIWPHAEDHTVWLAQYVDWPSYEGPFPFWQISESGRIDGIEGPVDFDVWFQDAVDREPLS